MNSSSTEPSELSPVLVALRTTFIICLGVLIIAGNLLSIAVTRHVSDLAESTKVLMITLAVSDLFIGFSTAFGVVASAMDRWPFGRICCQLMPVVQMVVSFMSVFSVVLLNLERYIAVTRPFKYPIWCSRHRILALVLVFLVLSVFNSISLQFIFEIPSEYLDSSAVCFLRMTSKYGGVIFLIVLVILPVSIMIRVYHRLIKISREQARRIDPNRRNANPSFYDNRALKAFLVVTLTLAGCFTPLMLCRSVESLAGVALPGWLEFSAVWLVYCNSALNVFIYCLFKQSYRRRAMGIVSKRLLCCRNSVEPVDI
ncbi:histamine H2 receptor-like [Patiria miniata]|uniref:G-protein coupled receptors family 1 profile domain-containing protein n=1 Tax=Patiria miniata TaxID=46514 RepID=A0A914BN46_PATMI|nr:histamine H2 receptor-like [Patiria miniata]